MHVWSVNIVGGFALALEQAGIQRREETLPAMCFLDLSGYTQLTQERGDAAAAELAERLIESCSASRCSTAAAR